MWIMKIKNPLCLFLCETLKCKSITIHSKKAFHTCLIFITNIKQFSFTHFTLQAFYPFFSLIFTGNYVFTYEMKSQFNTDAEIPEQYSIIIYSTTNTYLCHLYVAKLWVKDFFLIANLWSHSFSFLSSSLCFLSEQLCYTEWMNCIRCISHIHMNKSSINKYSRWIILFL